MTDIPGETFEEVGIPERDKPPFTVPPEPRKMFSQRSARFLALAEDHPLGAYLAFLGQLSSVQDEVFAALPTPLIPSVTAMRSRAIHGMPVLPRENLADDAGAMLALDRLAEAAAAIPMPEEAAAALAALRAAMPEEKRQMMAAVLSDAIPVETAASHIFVAAALQVAAAQAAAQVAADLPQPVADGVCPCCGGPPVTSAVVEWTIAPNTRYVQCSLCATRWNHVRIKCVACGSTEGIAYQAIEGLAGTIQAETCKRCRSYVKILHQHKDPALEPVADDVASLGLDILVREAGFSRASVNPFLLGY